MPSTGRRAITALAAVMIFTSGIAGVGLVGAQSDPGDPQSFFGEIESEDGTPAPVGTEVFAIIDGTVQDSIVIDEAGQYGGSEPFDDRLDVDTGAGDTVTFTVGSPDGPEALESPFDLDDADQTPFELDLTFSDGTFTDDPEFLVTIDESASTLEAEEGETLDVVADIENVGDESGTQDITAAVDDDLVAFEENVTLDPGADTTVTFEFTAELGFDGQDVTVESNDDTDTAPLTVTEATNPNFEVDIDESASTLEAEEGETLSVTADIENTGAETGTQDITATVGADQVAIAEDLTLDPGADTTVTLEFTAELVFDGDDVAVESADDVDTAPLTVTEADDEPEEPLFDIAINESTSTLEADEGDDLSVTAEVENIGGATGTQDVTATISDTQVGSETVSLDPTESETVTFTFTAETAFDGESVTVATADASDTAVVSVSPDTPAGGGGGGTGTGTGGASTGSVYEVSELDPLNATVTQGETLTVSATITNTGDRVGIKTTELTIDGESVADTSVRLSSGQTETVTFEGVPTDELDIGTYEHGVSTEDDELTGTLTIEDADTDPGDGEDGADDDDGADGEDGADDDDGVADDDTAADGVDDDTDDTDDAEEATPGFGAVVALVALLAAALIATRRRN